MKPKLKQLAEQAEFSLWAEEPWAPGDVIDWSARYDDELAKLYELMITEFYSTIEEAVKDRSYTTFDEAYLAHFRQHLKAKVKEKFDI